MTAEPAVPTSEPRWLDDGEQAAWRAYLDMSARLATQLNREMQDSTVQLSEYPDGRMRVLELARALRWEKSRLSHQLTRMERRGLLNRSGCGADRRGAYIVLSDEGRAAVERAAPAHVESVRRYLFDGLPRDLLESWATVSQHVIDRLAAAGTEPCATAVGPGAEPGCDIDPEPGCGTDTDTDAAPGSGTDAPADA